MEIKDINESDLLSFVHDFGSLYIQFNILLDTGEKIKLFANNKDTNPITVNYIGLNIKSNFTTQNNIPSLGEIENVEVTDTGFQFEGDMGLIQVVADNWYIGNDL